MIGEAFSDWIMLSSEVCLPVTLVCRRASLVVSLAMIVAARALGQSPVSQTNPIRIAADLSEAPRKLYHAEIDLPVKPGPLTLITPQWIPGNHRPTGPVEEITGVVFTAIIPGSGAQALPWTRDDVNLYEYHLTIPTGVTSLHAHLDCIVTSRATTKLAVLEWEKLLLYPANVPVGDIAVQPSVTVLAGWGTGIALIPVASGLPAVPVTGVDEVAHGAGNAPASATTTTRFAATTVEQLEDSPVLAGQYFHEYPLAPEITPKHFIDVAADNAADAELRPEFLAELSNLVREARAMYASRHYNVYHFLLTLSDVAGGDGLEHGQSSDIGVAANQFRDPEHQLAEADLMPHEFTHSWNGKYRRPAGLYQPDFATPQQGDLLWAYEGMTQYLGNVLAARAGLKTQEQYRDLLATVAANMDNRPGRDWRTNGDASISSSILRESGAAWANWRRSQDYYQDGELLWLDADTLIRQLTGDKRSLNDFVRLFLGKGGDTGPLILPYDLQEVIADLNQVAPYDWAKFIHDRIENINPRANLAGIERGGYRLIYADKPTKGESTEAASGSARGTPIDVWYSIGIRVVKDGTIMDVRWGGPADKAKLTPGQKIYAVNGMVFTGDGLKAAVREAMGKTEPIHLILQTDTFVSSADLDYHDGERYPTLERVQGTPDYLDEITKPLVVPTAAGALAQPVR